MLEHLSGLVGALRGQVLQKSERVRIDFRAVDSMTPTQSLFWGGLWFGSNGPMVMLGGGAKAWLAFLDRFRSRLSLVMPPNRSPCEVYDMRDWCDV